MEIVKAEEFGLEPNNVSNVDEAFAPKVKEREALSEIYGQVIKKDITPEVALEARELRLNATKIKSGIAQIHKTQKEYALAFGKYCDAWKRKETEPVQQMIDGLMAIEKFEERREQKRIDDLQAKRVEELLPYLEDAASKNLHIMDEDVWQSYLSTKKKECEERLAAEKKARAAEIELELEREKERERLAAENARLQAEARAAEQAKKKADAIIKAKYEAERKAYEEAEQQRQAELSKGDADKLEDLMRDLSALKTKYSFESDQYKKMYVNVGKLLDKINGYINNG